MRYPINPRMGLIVLSMLVLGFGGSATAKEEHKPKPKLDKQLTEKVEKAKKEKTAETVEVIIQTHDQASLASKIAKLQGKNAKGFTYFPGVVVEIPVDKLQEFEKDSTIDAISTNADVQATGPATG